MNGDIKGTLENSRHNFDSLLPHQGLIVYRVIDNLVITHPNDFFLGNDDDHSFRIEDAIPPQPPFTSISDFMTKQNMSLFQTAAVFGPESGVYEYTASDRWNWKLEDTVTADFMLSDGEGQKTVYVKCMDLNGEITALTPITIGSSTTPSPSESTKHGDATGDGNVDGLDYIVWVSNYNRTDASGPTQGDFTGDGRVDGLDYIIWLTNYEK